MESKSTIIGLIILSFLFFNLPLANSQSNCNNIGFEYGNFQNWQATEGEAGWPLVYSDPIFNRHTIITTQGLDPFGNGELFEIYPFGEGFSVRLGNDESGGYAEGLERTVQVTAESHSFLIAYAVIFEDPGHDEEEQPKFSFGIYNQSNQLIEGPCFGYAVAASANLPGFQVSQANDMVLFRNWTTIAVDLEDYIGQTVRFSFRNDDCTLGGHFGYAYFDLKCGRMEIQAQSCSNGEVLLAVPSGFSSYYWSTGDTTRTISITGADSGDVFMVEASTEFGCSVVLEYEYGADPFTEPEIFLSSFICDNQVSGVFTAPPGYNNYLWSNGETSATATYGSLNSLTEVSVLLSGGPTCDTTMVIPIEQSGITPTPIQTINISYCEGAETTLLQAPQNYAGYQWPDLTALPHYVAPNPQLNDVVSLWVTPTTSVCPELINYVFSNPIPENPVNYIPVPVCLLQESVNLNRPAQMQDGTWDFNASSAASALYPQPQYGDTVMIHGGDTSPNNCPISVGFVMKKKTPLVPDSLSTELFACIQSDTLLINPQAPFTEFSWTPSGSTDSILQVINPMNGDQISLSAIGNDDCPYYRLYNITGFPLADSTVSVGPFCESTTQLLLIGPFGNSDYVWFLDDVQVSAGMHSAWLNDPKPGSVITLEFTDSLGCRNTFEFPLNTNNIPTVLQLDQTPIPNAFSPALTDGMNDVLEFPFSNYDAFDLFVYNRWGQTVFSTSGTSESIIWDGKHDGRVLPGGTYFYHLSLNACNSQEGRSYKGSVQLMAD